MQWIERRINALRWKYIGFVVQIIGITFLMLSGCSNSVPELKEGTYEMSVHGEVGIAPSVIFDLKNSTFQFDFDYFSAYANIGSIVVSNGTVTGTTNDGKFHFSFEILSEDSIRFLASKSSSTKTMDGKIAVPDKTDFSYLAGSTDK